MNNLDFYVDMNDLIDIDISQLKSDIKDANINGKLILIVENVYRNLVLFFEENDKVNFYNYSEVSGISSKYSARNLETAISKASCLGLYSDAISIQKVKQANDGRVPIDQKKLGIDYELKGFPKEKPIKKDKMTESSKEDTLKKLNKLCKKLNYWSEDALFFTTTSKGVLVKGWMVDEAFNDSDDLDWCWRRITSDVPELKDLLTPISYKDAQLYLTFANEKLSESKLTKRR